MVKKRLIALGVSVAAITAVAGAGFAGWTFTSEAKQEAKLGVNITAAYSFGTVAIDTDAPDTVVLDQSGVTLAKTGALGTAIADVTAAWTVNTVSYTDATTNAVLTYTVNVYVKGTADSGLAKYVVANTPDTTKTAPARDGYVGYVYTLTPAAGDIKTGVNDTVVTLTLANPLDFVEANKPNTFAKYQTMVTEITGQSTVNTDQAYTVAVDDAPVIFEFVVTKTTA